MHTPIQLVYNHSYSEGVSWYGAMSPSRSLRSEKDPRGKLTYLVQEVLYSPCMFKSLCSIPDDNAHSKGKEHGLLV